VKYQKLKPQSTCSADTRLQSLVFHPVSVESLVPLVGVDGSSYTQQEIASIPQSSYDAALDQYINYGRRLEIHYPPPWTRSANRCSPFKAGLFCSALIMPGNP